MSRSAVKNRRPDQEVTRAGHTVRIYSEYGAVGGQRTPSGMRWKVICSCEYESLWRISENSALRAVVVHLRHVDPTLSGRSDAHRRANGL